MGELTVTVWSADPLTREGAAAMLRSAPGVTVVSMDELPRADVVLIAGHTLGSGAVELINHVYSRSTARIVLLIDELTDDDLRLAITRPVMALVARSTVTSAGLLDAVRAAYQQHTRPRLLDDVERIRSGRLRPRGTHATSLAPREQEVLRLLAEGCDTTEIAGRMSYSERTVKNIIRVVLDRLGSRNRAHAVAFATREGLV